jgi:MYND finger
MTTRIRAGRAVVISEEAEGVQPASLRGCRAFVLVTESHPTPGHKDSRVPVKLFEVQPDEPDTFLVKPCVLKAACAGCWKEPTAAAPHKRCSKCFGPQYCNAACQLADWGRHKKECKLLAKVRDEGEVAGSLPPGPGGAPVSTANFPGGPWRRTLETAAMSTEGFPCYLTAHRNQRFRPALSLLGPHTYPGTGAIEPAMLPLLREAVPEDVETYYKRSVPNHWPPVTCLGLIG